MQEKKKSNKLLIIMLTIASVVFTILVTKVDVKPIITDIYDSKDAIKAFEKNRDKASVKVVIKFS